MLWTSDGNGTPEDTEVIEEIEVTPIVEAEVAQEEPEAPKQSKEGTGDDVGESRYARKSRHLPRIGDEDGSSSTGSGLRNAIIQPKRGDGS
jgi:hypothetical protein